MPLKLAMTTSAAALAADADLAPSRALEANRRQRPIQHCHGHKQSILVSSRSENFNCYSLQNFSRLIEGRRERTELSIYFFFSAHHSMVFYFRCSVYWWKGSVRFECFKILLVKY